MTFSKMGLILKSLEAAGAIFNARSWAEPQTPVGILHARFTPKKGIRAMTKSLEVIDETVRNAKHPFRKTDNQPKKALKHRHERRKIKAYLNVADWLAEEAV
jgi:hypothetical protein